jgi:hypothetical protein
MHTYIHTYIYIYYSAYSERDPPEEPRAPHPQAAATGTKVLSYWYKSTCLLAQIAGVNICSVVLVQLLSRRTCCTSAPRSKNATLLSRTHALKACFAAVAAHLLCQHTTPDALAVRQSNTLLSRTAAVTSYSLLSRRTCCTSTPHLTRLLCASPSVLAAVRERVVMVQQVRRDSSGLEICRFS